MKFDQKYIIIILVAVIGVMAGMMINKPSPQAQMASQTPADDGKLAKAYKEENLVKAIRENAKNLQMCYLTYLDKKVQPSEGVMNLLVKVEENGKLSDVQITKNDFQNSDFANCIVEKVNKFFLAPPPLGINRYISHELAFKSEETANREAKEREEKNRPPKVLPVNQ